MNEYSLAKVQLSLLVSLSLVLLQKLMEWLTICKLACTFLTFFLCCDAWSRCVDRQHFGRRGKRFRSWCVTDRTAWNHFWRSDDSEGNACWYHPLDIGLQESILWASPTASKSCCQNYQVSWPRFSRLHLLLICHSVNDCTALIRVILKSH